MKFKLKGQLVTAFLALGLVPLCVLAFISINSARDIGKQAFDQLEQSAISTMDTVERNLFERYGDVQAFASNGALHIHPLGSPEATVVLTEAINTYVRLYGLYPLSYITDATGKVVAVNTKDAAGNPLDTAFLLGKDMSKTSWFRDTRAGKFLKSDLLDGTVVEDVARDPDASGLFGPDALFVSYSAPILSATGEFVGVWRNLADFGLVETMIKERYVSLKSFGLPSAELVLIDKKGVLLAEYDPSASGTADFRRNPNTILKFNLAEDGSSFAKRGILGENGKDVAFHTRKKIMLAGGFAHSTGALGYPGLGWTLIVRAPESELLAGPNAAIRNTWITVGIAAALLIACSLLIARSLTRPIASCVAAVERLALGDLTTQVTITRTDEIGTLGQSINTCTTNLRQLVSSLTQSATELVTSANVLTETSHSQAAAAEETTVQAHTVASAGEELSINSKTMAESAAQITQSTGTVAAAMEEMSSSIQEVARNCAQESAIAQKADTQARQTRELMGKLDESARQIGKVVELINRIAEQTNLLALNATIEAASAGEAGRGFAVVANEVKELARQSAAATEDIRKQVALIQDNAGASMRSLDEVAKVIEQVSHISSSIAAAVEQQSATTSEIVGTIHNVSTATSTLSMNVQQTAEGAAEVARNISGVSQAAADVAKSAALTSSSASELNELSATLGLLVAKFKV